MVAATQGGGVATVTTTLDPAKKGPDLLLSNGDLRVTHDTLNTWETVLATVSKTTATTTGYYFEVTPVFTTFSRIGIAVAAIDVTGFMYIAATASSQGASSDNASGFGTAYATGDVIGIYLKNSKIYFRRNGTWTGDPVAETGGTAVSVGTPVFPAISLNAATEYADANFGATAFAGAIPSGGVSWNTV